MNKYAVVTMYAVLAALLCLSPLLLDAAPSDVTYKGKVTLSGAVHTTSFANSVTSNAVTISASNGDSQSLALTAATGTVAITLSGFAAGDTLSLTITQKASSPVNVSWTGVKWPGGTAPTISTGASAIDEIQLKCTATSVYNGTFVQNFQ